MTPPEDDEQDLTRKQRREQARAERKAAEEAVAANAARRRRLSQLGGAAVVVIVAIVVILVATGSGGGKAKVHTDPHNSENLHQRAVVEEEINGIPQSANVLGSPAAPATLEYFGDLECPYCREFTVVTLPKLIQKYVRTDKLKIVYRSLETATREPETFRTQQSAALAAGKQNKMWYFVELFYHEQGEEDSGYVTEKYLQGLAEQVPGLNLAQWSADRGNGKWSEMLAQDTQEANNRGFSGTPSFLVGRTGGALKKLEYSSVGEEGSFDSAIEPLVKS